MDSRDSERMRSAHGDESKQLSTNEGVKLLENAPIPEGTKITVFRECCKNAVCLYFEPPSANEKCISRYLWVVVATPCEVRYIEENAPATFSLNRGSACHTNLTGGQEAFCGGELWFLGNDEVHISGASGRYPPRSNQELEDACQIFVRKNYKTYCLGWDEDIARPARVCRKKGSGKWIS